MTRAAFALLACGVLAFSAPLVCAENAEVTPLAAKPFVGFGFGGDAAYRSRPLAGERTLGDPRTPCFGCQTASGPQIVNAALYTGATRPVSRMVPRYTRIVAARPEEETVPEVEAAPVERVVEKRIVYVQQPRVRYIVHRPCLTAWDTYYAPCHSYYAPACGWGWGWRGCGWRGWGWRGCGWRGWGWRGCGWRGWGWRGGWGGCW